MARLDKDRQAELEPKRMETAKSEITKLGYEILTETETELTFLFNGKKIHYFPYSGWHSGMGIKDGRGLKKLLNQINK